MTELKWTAAGTETGERHLALEGELISGTVMDLGYHCQGCDRRLSFGELVESDKDGAMLECPSCGSAEVRRLAREQMA